MKDLEISLDADHDLWMLESLGGITLHAEDGTDLVTLQLDNQQAEQVCEWLKAYLKK